MFVRLVREYSDVYRWRKWIIESGRMEYGHPRFDAFIAIKSHFFASPWMFTLFCVLFSIIFFAYCVCK